MYEGSASESGQALILIALAFIMLIGFAAMSIDGGMIYSDRRLAQASSDSASLSGAGLAALHLANELVYSTNFNCNLASVRAAESIAATSAINLASANGFSIDADPSDGNGVEVICQSYDNGSYPVRYLDVTTHISQTVETGFMQLLYSGKIYNHVTATARVRPLTPEAHGYAIVALNDADCLGHQNGVMLSGDIDVLIDGGGIFSNGCLRGNGSSLVVDVSGAPIRYEGDLECDPDGCPGFTPAPSPATGGDLPEDSYYIAPPDCRSLEEKGKVSKSGTITPGIYTEINLHATGDTLIMEPGLYCLTGSPKAMVISGGTLIGNDVTIYVENGEVALSGNASVTLTAPRDPEASPEIFGVVIYLAEGNTGAVELEGNSDTWIQGTVYAPDGFIEAKGVSGMHPTLHTQLIGHDVEIGGNADINIVFDPSGAPGKDAIVDMWK